MALLSRVADRIYWAARYIERAEGTARVLSSFGNTLADLSTDGAASWQPLVAVTGGDEEMPKVDGSDEMPVVQYLLSDRENHNSIVMSIEYCRENLRTCREVLPREAWQTVNDLNLYSRSAGKNSITRRTRGAYLTRVINDSRRLDGVLTSTMTRDEAYEIWRLGRFVERADMTTRVLGVRASALLSVDLGAPDEFAEVLWMSVLRSLSAHQMYQRASKGSIDGPTVVRFLLFDHRFPRSVAGCLTEMRSSLLRMPTSETVLFALEAADRTLRNCRPAADDGAGLDQAMDDMQGALGAVSDAVRSRYGQI